MYTVRQFNTMISVLLMRAGISEDEICRIKGTFGGSTCTWHLKPEGCRAPGFRRELVGGSARTCHLLARSRPARRSADRSRRPRLERFPVRYLGASAGLGQGTLKAEPRAFDNQRVPAQRAAQRHPGWHPRSVSRCDGVPNQRRRPLRFRPLTREGDIRGDVHHSCCSRMFSPNTAAYRSRSPGVTSS